MHRIFYSLVFFLDFFVLHGQIPFSILPDVGGINRQAMGLIGITDSTDIMVIGHRYDTILPGPNTKPYLAHFQYDGQLKYVVPITDSLYAEPFNLYTIPLEKKNDSIYYYRAQRDIGDPYFQPYLMELNIKTGKVLRSTVIINAEYPLLSSQGEFIKYIDTNTLLLSNTLHKGDSVMTYISILDSLFNVKKVIKIKEASKKSFAQVCSLNSDGSFLIVGYCKIENGQWNDYYNFYRDRIDSNGFVLEHTLAPTTIPISRGVYGTRTVLKDINGNWIIGGTYHEDLSDLCANCYQLIPYIFSTTPDFKTLRWQTRFFDIPTYEAPQYSLYSMTQVVDGYIVCGDFFNYNGYDSGVLFKAANNGDSLWMKHYIPLDWEEDRVAWVRFHDINTSPYGTIVVAGAVGDIQENIIRPWILQLDKDGCLVPGCNTVATHDENSKKPQPNFTIYPNPASLEIYVLSKITSTYPLHSASSQMKASKSKEEILILYQDISMPCR
ncbi:MAG TPA: hypothetical protein VFG10_12870 [Saprospiraceae bacterium]|nr:hypothetical protein [Saprospiraceae bacterium]